MTVRRCLVVLPALALPLVLSGCGADAGATRGATAQSGDAAGDQHHFEISGHEQQETVPRVMVLVDPGDGSSLFSDGIPRYEVRMLPDPLGKDDLTVWIANLRADLTPGRHALTSSVGGPTVLVGVGHGLVKGYNQVLAGHLELEEIGERLAFTFEAELRSESALDRDRRGKEVTVRGRVVAAATPQ